MTQSQGRLHGQDRFVLLAGALAEAGVTSLILESPNGGETILGARVTDLPAMLAQAEPGTRVRSPSGSISLFLQPTHLEWACAPSEPAAQRLGTILRAHAP